MRGRALLSVVDEVRACRRTLMSSEPGLLPSVESKGKEGAISLSPMSPPSRLVAGLGFQHHALWANLPVPPLAGAALLCCHSEVQDLFSQGLRLMKGRANSFPLMTSLFIINLEVRMSGISQPILLL